ncbi:MAG: TIGR02186 family protein [Pseudomonadota bacterium]
MIRAALLWFLAALPAQAEEIVTGVSQNRIAITADFDGSEILIFGAVKREAPAPEGQMNVIVTVAGPSRPVMVRRKERIFGIWVNRDAVEVDLAPSFYAITTTGPLSEILKDIEDLRHKISIPRAIRSVGAEVNGAEAFTEALIRIRSEADLYKIAETTIDLRADTLFQTSVQLPANLIEGDYTVRTILTRNGDVITLDETIIDVRKVGLERWLYNLAHERPLIYGLLSLTIAIAAGWGASAVFRYIRS